MSHTENTFRYDDFVSHLSNPVILKRISLQMIMISVCSFPFCTQGDVCKPCFSNINAADTILETSICFPLGDMQTLDKEHSILFRHESMTSSSAGSIYNRPKNTLRGDTECTGLAEEIGSTVQQSQTASDI